MRKIVVTPAGRQRYLEVLYLNMLRELRTFDEWHLWINTNIESDIQYCKKLASENDWIKTIEIENIQSVDNLNIHKFFKYAQDPQAIYIRLDDDIVYLEPDFFEKLFRFRQENPDPFLIYGNIINNAIISHIHQKNNRFQFNQQAGYHCTDRIGWDNAHYAEAIHRSFIHDTRTGQLDKWHRSFETWVCSQYERVSINCISWLGSTFNAFNGDVGRDEEEWLSTQKPREISKPNVIYSGAIAAHFSFYTQRPHLDSTNLLEEYKSIV